ncbi:hypothetical protein [Lactiplantibacillus plantarum]|uniref:hypothetical protein n=1 Tax=Lactiplantibacillus plantarum TaxID=1590 RepID=UPI0022700026|nr:hypothetical protein [Lactiplantibacillus plantarum]MDN7038289.1 hypothetical protein [Lactiplantibacillus plantarum]MDO7795382.1 hypothetical protein [Lactiplantibacillus plantarum]
MRSDIGVGFDGATNATGSNISTVWIGFYFDGKDYSIQVNNSGLSLNDFRRHCVNAAFEELAHLLKIERDTPEDDV